MSVFLRFSVDDVVILRCFSGDFYRVLIETDKDRKMELLILETNSGDRAHRLLNAITRVNRWFSDNTDTQYYTLTAKGIPDKDKYTQHDYYLDESIPQEVKDGLRLFQEALLDKGLLRKPTKKRHFHPEVRASDLARPENLTYNGDEYEFARGDEDDEVSIGWNKKELEINETDNNS